MVDSNELYSRAMRGAIKFLEQKDYSVVEKLFSENIDLVCMDSLDNIHFIKVNVSTDTFKNYDIEELRPKLEEEALDFFSKNPEYIGSCTFDIMSMIVINNNKAFLRFHQNCLN